MDSQGLPAEIQVFNSCDDSTFISVDNSSRERATNSTCRPEFPPQEASGYDFQPLNVGAGNVM